MDNLPLIKLTPYIDSKLTSALQAHRNNRLRVCPSTGMPDSVSVTLDVLAQEHGAGFYHCLENIPKIVLVGFYEDKKHKALAKAQRNNLQYLIAKLVFQLQKKGREPALFVQGRAGYYTQQLLGRFVPEKGFTYYWGPKGTIQKIETAQVGIENKLLTHLGHSQLDVAFNSDPRLIAERVDKNAKMTGAEGRRYCLASARICEQLGGVLTADDEYAFKRIIHWLKNRVQVAIQIQPLYRLLMGNIERSAKEAHIGCAGMVMPYLPPRFKA